MMKTLKISSLIAGFVLCAAAHAQAPAAAPAGSTGMCKDGSYASSAEKKGACKGHKGVKEWYAAAPAAAATTAAPAPKPAAVPASAASKRAMPQPAAVAAPGGGPGMVWVNESSKVYHCADDKWYGKTKAGNYLTEADAKAKGYHGVRGKACAATK